MSDQKRTETSEGQSLWQCIRSRLAEHGVYVGIKKIDDLSSLGLETPKDLEVEFTGSEGRVKVVCVAPDLKSSAEEMKETPRDQVIMVRVDEETRSKLDDWVETGAIKSRSEAAALFIREGLKVREDELERLRDALGEVEAAKERLHEQAREVFGGQAGGTAE